MDIPTGDLALGIGYVSASQRTRVITEAWIGQNGYCLACESDRLTATSANTQSRDFECPHCGHPYELKSSRSPFGTRVVDGAYSSMMRRIQNSTVPSFLLLQYSPSWRVINLTAIHHALISPVAIQRRTPLAASARRAGWVGCNLLLSKIPNEGRISMVSQGIAANKSLCRKSFAATGQFARLTPEGKSWTATTLRLLHSLGSRNFSIQDAYTLECELSQVFPENKNIRAKIRQQLQVLRDAGFLIFESRGNYKFRY